MHRKKEQKKQRLTKYIQIWGRKNRACLSNAILLLTRKEEAV
jgi:hypothetical protein